MEQKKFNFKTSEILQGDYALKDLNLMLVFQVNCPGCFIYALPAANKVVEDYEAKGIKVLGLATAFEDFDQNTLNHTKLLLSDGRLVGETKKALNKAGHEIFPLKLKFDVAFDDLKESDLSNIDQKVDAYIATIPDFSAKNEVEMRLIRGQVKEYLSNKTMSAHTFDTNFLMGTPSWILFDRDMNIVFEFFGHKDYAVLQERLDLALEQYRKNS